MQTKQKFGGSQILNARDILDNQLGLTYGATVADLGCGGSGFFVFQAADLVGKEGVVYAVDILDMVLKNIANRANMLGMHNVKTVRSNLERYGATPIHDETLDFALLVTVLFQNKHPERVIKESVRMLKSKGGCLVVDWKQGRFPFGPKADIKLDMQKVEDYALAAGLKKVKEIEVGRFHYGLIFEKI